jgi:hypothetical protein
VESHAGALPSRSASIENRTSRPTRACWMTTLTASTTFNWGYYLESLRLYCITGQGKPFPAALAHWS